MLDLNVYRTPSYTPRSENRGERSMPIWERVTDPKKICFLQFDNSVETIMPKLTRVKFWNSLNLSDSKLWVDL